jgi:hypothetical protein
MSLFTLKPTHAPVKAYYAALAQFQLHGHTTEGSTRGVYTPLHYVVAVASSDSLHSNIGERLG